MTIIDYAIIGILATSCVLGVIRGLTHETLSLISWIGSGISAYLLFPIARGFSQEHIHHPMIADAVAVVSTFILFLIVFSLISHTISNYVKASPLGGVDRSLGLAFGIIRAIVVLTGFELIMSSFMPRSQYPQSIQNARFMPMIQNGSDVFLTALPEKVKDFITTQQGKFIQEEAKKKIEQEAQKTVEKEVTSDIESVISKISGESQSLKKPLIAPQQNPAQTKHPGTKETLDTQKATENLAKLKAQGSQEEKKGYDKNQREEMNRLIETIK